jgi:hypothetical protein
MRDIHEAEQEIFRAWHILDDIKTLLEGVLEHDYTPDQVANALQGMVEVYDIRFQHIINDFQQRAYPNTTLPNVG